MNDSPRGTATLTDGDRRRLAALTARDGERGAVAALGVARQTFARLAAGLPVLRHTAEAVSGRLARLDAAEPTRAA